MKNFVLCTRLRKHLLFRTALFVQFPLFVSFPILLMLGPICTQTLQARDLFRANYVVVSRYDWDALFGQERPSGRRLTNGLSFEVWLPFFPEHGFLQVGNLPTGFPPSMVLLDHVGVFDLVGCLADVWDSTTGHPC